MANRSTVVVELNLEDNFSGQLRRLRVGIDNEVRQASRGVNSLVSGAMVGISAALTSKIVEGVGAAMGVIKDQFNKAVSLEEQIITGGNKLQFYGVFGEDLQSNMDGFKDIMGELEKVAADLPGVTEEYLDVYGQLSGSLAKAKGDMSMDEFKSFSVETAKNFGLLQQAGKQLGLLPKDIARGFQDYVEDGKFSSNDIELLTKGGAFSDALAAIQAVEGVGKDKIERASQMARAAEDSISPEAIIAYSNSVGALIEGFKTSLFGMEGMFSFSKDLFDDIDGDQSILNEVKEILKALLGKDGIFSSIASIFGFTGDEPMQVVFNALVSFKHWIRRVQGIFYQFKKTLEGKSDIEKIASIAGVLQDGMNGFLEKASEAIVNVLFVKPLNALAEDPIGAAKYMFIMATAGTKAVFAIGRGIANAVKNISWEGWVAIGIAAVVVPAVIGALGSAIAGALTVLGGAILAGLSGVIAAISIPFLPLIAAVGATVAGIALLVGFLKSGFMSNILTSLKNGFNSFKSKVVEFFKPLTDIISNDLQEIKQVINETLAVLKEPIDELKLIFSELFNFISVEIKKIYAELKPVIDVIGKIFKTIAGGMLIGLVGVIVVGIVGIVKIIKWVVIGISKLIKNIMFPIRLLFALITGDIDGVKSLLSEQFNMLTDPIKSIFNFIKEWVDKIVGWMPGAAGGTSDGASGEALHADKDYSELSLMDKFNKFATRNIDKTSASPVTTKPFSSKNLNALQSSNSVNTNNNSNKTEYNDKSTMVVNITSGAKAEDIIAVIDQAKREREYRTIGLA